MRKAVASSVTVLFALAVPACGDTLTEPAPATDVPAVANATLPKGEGVQKIVEPLNCDASDRTACRGTFVLVPPLATDPVTVGSGTWITAGFDIHNCSLDGAEVDEPYRTSILDFLAGFGWSFDGQALPVEESVRFGATTFTEAQGCGPGGEDGHVGITPVRYFIPPQSPGTYQLLATFGATVFFRDVTWETRSL